jgi:lysophospholipase L1-like esterase
MSPRRLFGAFVGSALALSLTIIIFQNFAGAAPAATIHIAAIGDSNIRGRGVVEEDSYPAILERALKAKGFDVRVLNSGLNGDTIAGVLARLDSAAPPDTQIAIVWIGANDKRAGTDPTRIRAGRQKIVDRLQARGIEVLSFCCEQFKDLRDNPRLNLGDGQKHFNAAGYERIVERTLPDVITLIERVNKKTTPSN